MINETMISFANNTAPLVVQFVAKSNWTQYILSLLIGSIFVFWMLSKMLGTSVYGILTKQYLRLLTKITKQNVILLKHTNTGIFSLNMITMEDYDRLRAIVNTFNNEPFSIVLHTPGGDMFASMMISKLLSQYPGQTSVFIPNYAMSGGTLLALSCNNIYMSKNATLGPVDPQLGAFWKSGSARAWKELQSYKGKKIDDSSFIYSFASKQAEKEMIDFIKPLILLKVEGIDNYKTTINLLTSGDLLHSHQFSPFDLSQMGFKKIHVIDKKLYVLLHKLVTLKTEKNIFFARYKK